MGMFIERPASVGALMKRKLVYGVGINDASYVIKYKVKEGKWVSCPYYERWRKMLERCYSSKYHARQPTYTACSVHEDWHTFSTFKTWMVVQDWEGKHLDKDLLVEGNKTYSKDTCLFVSRGLNNLFLSKPSLRGEYPLGVTFDVAVGMYRARCNSSTKSKYLGYFRSVSQAEAAYCEYKASVILSYAAGGEGGSHPLLRPALLHKAQVFSDKAANLLNLQTIKKAAYYN
jgi:hypothetical protein